MRKVKKGWLLFGVFALALGILSLHNGTVFVFEKAKGSYSVTEIEDRVRYWTFTMMYFHDFVFCLFVSMKAYYPNRLRSLMSFNDESNLNVYQIIFVLLVAAILFGSSTYISLAITNS